MPGSVPLTERDRSDGIAGANRLLLSAAVELFDTDDARNGIRTYLESGSGPAAFSGS